MIGRMMEEWSEVELQRVADAVVWQYGAKDDVWSNCLRGHQCGGDKELAQKLDKLEQLKRPKWFRTTLRFGSSYHFDKYPPMCDFTLARRYDWLCAKNGQDLIVRMIQNRARKILATRIIAATTVVLLPLEVVT